MSLNRAIALILMTASGVIVVAANIKMNRLMHVIRSENYGVPNVQSWWWTAMMQASMLVMYAGQAAALVVLCIEEVSAVRVFFTGVFLISALLVYVMVCVMRIMETNIIQKKRDILRTLVNSIEMKDEYTMGHSEHVFNIVRLFCRQLDKERKKICNYKLLDAALLHDIGKIGVDDTILTKPGILTQEEWVEMKRHPAVGKKLLDDTFFSVIGQWVLYHHERMDGHGYYGLLGEDIPIESRIIAIADTYSALTTNRAYRKSMDHPQAVEIMKCSAGTQLDALLLDCFFTIEPEALRNCAVRTQSVDGDAPAAHAHLTNMGPID